MKNPKELKNMWIRVREIYADTREGRVDDTVQKIVDEFGLDDVIEVFATVAAIKKHDGRIAGRNRTFMDSIPVNPDAVRWESDNPMIRAGLDDIHTAHIDQMITELRKMKAEMA